MRRLAVPILMLTVTLAGCGGQYILTAPEQIAPAGGQVRAVVRLQRQEFFRLTPAVENALLRFSADDGPVRAAYTDADGYAGANVPAPPDPGRYALTVAHQDDEGEQFTKSTPLFVLPADATIVAVDADCLGDGEQGASAVAALRTVADDANILYMTQADISEHDRLRQRLQQRNYPDGPILLWQRRRWRLTEGKWRIPKIEFEDRLVSQLAELREDLPGLSYGICRGPKAAAAFAEAGLETIVVGDKDVPDEHVSWRSSWDELAEKGL
ncbi:MAG: hypothetical protein ACLFVW_07650 [Phycisphaerae bacterium]